MVVFRSLPLMSVLGSPVLAYFLYIRRLACGFARAVLTKKQQIRANGSILQLSVLRAGSFSSIGKHPSTLAENDYVTYFSK